MQVLSIHIVDTTCAIHVTILVDPAVIIIKNVFISGEGSVFNSLTLTLRLSYVISLLLEVILWFKMYRLRIERYILS